MMLQPSRLGSEYWLHHELENLSFQPPNLVVALHSHSLIPHNQLQQQITLVSYCFKIHPGSNHSDTTPPSRFMLPSSLTWINKQEPLNNSLYKSDQVMPLLMELISLRVKAQIPAMIYKALCILHPTPLLLCLLQPQCLIAAPQTPGTV